MKDSIKRVGYLYFLSLKAVSSMKLSCMRSEPTILEFVRERSFVEDYGLSATYVIFYPIFNKKVQVIYRSKNGGSTIFPL